MSARASLRRAAPALARGALALAGAALALAAGALALACGGADAPSGPAAPPVMVERASAHTVMDRIQATGQLVAQAEATVAAQVGGEITGIVADEGAAVAAGEPIVAIDPERRQLELENAQASLLQAQAQEREAAREAQRLEKLAGRGAVSQAQLDEARTRRDFARSGAAAAEAQLGLAQRALRDASVVAPFAGLVARRFVNPGEFVAVGAPLFHLVTLDPVEVEFHLAEVDSARVAAGQRVEVRVASFPDEVFGAEVTLVAPTIDPAARTRRVKAVLANPEGRLLPGTFARVDLGVAERSGVVMVAKEAVLQRSDGSVVFRLAGGDRVERVRVETGVHRDELVELRGGVAAGDWIVVRGHTGLVDGAPVSLRNADGTATSAATLGVAAGPGNDG
jgi:membrane fusion protein (multidrug efflux system)